MINTATVLKIAINTHETVKHAITISKEGARGYMTFIQKTLKPRIQIIVFSVTTNGYP